MAQASPKAHIPYAIRYMARLQEQAAQASDSDSRSIDLNQTAQEMRVAVRSLAPVAQEPRTVAAADLPQKVKLLNWLRQPK